MARTPLRGARIIADQIGTLIRVNPRPSASSAAIPFMMLRKQKPALPVVQDDLATKLAAEARTCPTCSYAITNPMTDRCPRCFSMVALSEHTNCGECSHQGSCEFQKLHAMRTK
jgi:uncharacterized paraquat-inducible protein A